MVYFFTCRALVEYAEITRSNEIDDIHLHNQTTYLTKEHCVSLVAPSDLVMASPKTNVRFTFSSKPTYSTGDTTRKTFVWKSEISILNYVIMILL